MNHFDGRLAKPLTHRCNSEVEAEDYVAEHPSEVAYVMHGEVLVSTFCGDECK